MEEREYWIALNALAGMSAGKKEWLIKEVGSAREVFRSRKKITSWRECRPLFIQSLQGADPESIYTQEEEKARRDGMAIIARQDSEFPSLLKEIADPPLALYVKGNLPADPGRSLAVVGSRLVSHYGRVVTESITRDLLAYGFWIVSGLARGIDSIAHKTAVRGGGKTIAVLGSGLDVIYPPENKNLARQIVESGAVISEFPFGTGPQKMNFPIRNRIISGLCPGMLVIEAGERSGALITANCALDQGREVLAIPGNITSPNSKGVNALIKQGARLVDGVEDILEELGFQIDDNESMISSLKLSPPDLSEGESRILSFLTYNPISIDLIIQKSGEPPSSIHSALLTLEMKGVIKQLPGKLFYRT
ncbi:MAG: DNA-processing protein DprA [bacterium]